MFNYVGNKLGEDTAIELTSALTFGVTVTMYYLKENTVVSIL